MYVSDAFGTLHRGDTSVSVLPQHFPGQRAIGFLVERELDRLGKLMTDAEKPFVGVLGGAKGSDKTGVIDALLSPVDALVVGGAMCVYEPSDLSAWLSVLRACKDPPPGRV